MLIDNWGRDFTENYATTDENASDPALRPVTSDLAPSVLTEQMTSWVAKQSRWKLESSSTDADGRVKLHLIRTTLIWRFKDDIHVTISPRPSAVDDSRPSAVDDSQGGSIVTAESQSRIGKGDLGQNPRNLRELLGVIRK